MPALVVVFALLLLTSGCAGRSVTPAITAPLADFEELVQRGCYRCLLEAFETASHANAREHAFEAALLLAVRSNELGLPAEAWLAHARAVLPPDPGWAMYLQIAEAQQPDPLSGDRDALLLRQQTGRRPGPDVYAEWRERLTSGPGSASLRAYLDLPIACRRQQFEGRDEAAAAVLAGFDKTPLILYRVGLCGGDHSRQLAAAQEIEAELVDADLELGRRAAREEHPPDMAEAFRRLRSAGLAFPDSPLIPAVAGDLRRAREEWPEALAEYDAAIALVPTHRDALLGRTMSLSYLSRHEEAIGSATRLIELGSWFLGDAHYWRAWSEYQLGRMEAARADTDTAKTLVRNAPTWMLSGLIEWREKRLETAEREFEEALGMDFGQCDAAAYLGNVRAERQRWPESLSAFQHAGQCFDLSIVTRRRAIAELSGTPEQAALNARQIASHERAIADAQRRRDEAARNVASLERLIAPIGSAEQP